MHKGWINPFVPISSLVPMEKNQITNRVKEILKYHPSTLYSAFLVTWKCVLSRSLSRKYSRSCLMLSIEHDSILDSAVIICWIEGSFIKWPPCSYGGKDLHRKHPGKKQMLTTCSNNSLSPFQCSKYISSPQEDICLDTGSLFQMK